MHGFQNDENGFKTKYLVSYWVLTHHFNISDRGVQYDFDDLQWVQVVALLVVVGFRLRLVLDYFWIVECCMDKFGV